MDSESNKPDPDDPTWSFHDSHSYNMLPSEFPWNYDPSELADVDIYQPCDITPASVISQGASSSQVAASTTTSTSNPSVSSSSSEDPTEKTATATAAATVADTSTKVKKKAQKRMRQPRFAFMTKSEVDHLEDGYRWRKYGQKAVKNSPFPRSYYRCTNSKCTVKKRVERSSEDPSVVVTTYEGQHCHHTVGFPRSTGFLSPEGGFLGQFAPPLSQRLAYPGMQFSQESSANITQAEFSITQGSVSNIQTRVQTVPAARELPPVPQARQQVVPPSSGEGLLGDIVPSGMRNP